MEPDEDAPEATDQPDSTEDAAQEAAESTEDDFDALPEATKTEIRALRRENQRLRKAAKATKAPEPASKDATAPTGQSALIAKLAEALGVDMGAVTTPEPPKTPDSSNELRLARVELAVYKVAGATGVDPDALLDSRAFLREIEDLDPTDASFETDIRDAAKTALAANPNLRAKSANGQRKSPSKSGGDMAGGKSPGTQEYATPQQRLAAAYAASNP
jgi:hypothetical protein